MARKLVAASRAPISKAPLSQGLIVEGRRWLFCSGQLGVDAKSGKLAEGIEAQTRCALENLRVILEAGGASLADVVKVTVFLVDMADFTTVNEIYRQYFTEPFPTRSAVQVSGLARGARVEIEALAVVD